MLTDYIHAAMRQATYEKLEDGAYYGEFPGLRGVYAHAASLEGCREELRSSLEDWLLFSLVNGFSVPPIGGIDLTAARVA